jgi:crotonobetainyl-CoA:carnitine CoA-transferase CaiB-like acyl-CoA transferase
VARFEAAGVPAGPINTLDQALADPHIEARGLLQQVEGRRFVRAPLTFSKTPVRLKYGPPALGKDTRAVLAEAGFSGEEIDDLASSGAVSVGVGQEGAAV